MMEKTLREFNMKIFVVLALLSLLVLTACGSDLSSNDQTNAQDQVGGNAGTDGEDNDAAGDTAEVHGKSEEKGNSQGKGQGQDKEQARGQNKDKGKDGEEKGDKDKNDEGDDEENGVQGYCRQDRDKKHPALAEVFGGGGG